jgi:hypothetical protein
MKDFRLPAPERTDAVLKKDRHNAIAVYAAEMAGTEFDLDPDLESAAVEQMMRD